MVVEARRIGLDPIAAAAQKLVQRQADLLGRQVPERDLQRFLERQGEAALVAAARAADPIDQRHRRLSLESGQTSSANTRSISASSGSG